MWEEGATPLTPQHQTHRINHSRQQGEEPDATVGGDFLDSGLVNYGWQGFSLFEKQEKAYQAEGEHE